ncbi:ESPR-type extended signal peptide-containing protein [Acinetobacter sp. ABJ-A23_2]|uniref:ESPR-type extended signal peptide-containing protein n=1 Tax=Acinetobacter sp. ABJ-A23_2 TaxID=3376991 RepID=UPI0037C59D39
MNKIYKVIWNASLGIWVAVSEIAKGHSKTRSQRTNNALMPSTEATDFLQSSTSINFKIKPLTWGILTVLVPSITFGEVGVSGGFATGNNATAISACTGTGVGGTGDRATAGGERALAIGCGAVTDSDRDIAIGSQASTANPANATGTYNESIAIGAESRASGSQALAIGGQATATGNSSVAIGADDMDKVASTNPPAYNYTPTAGDNALYNNTATAAAYKNLTGDYLVDFEKTNGGASGVGNRYTRVQTGEAAVAVGPKATATDLGTALGPVATAGSIASVAVGVKAEARGQGSLSIGSLAYTANTGDVAVGINSAATGGDSIAIGAGSDLKGTPYVQSGASASKKGASASGANSISIGTNTAATGTNAVVVGTQSTASNLAVAVGSVATAGDQSVSIGSNSAASSQTSVAIGARAQALQANSVALGSDSVADRASGSLGYDPLTETSTTSTNSTWKATDAAVSVGNGTTRTRQITSVAAGTNDTDAANVAQLKKATSKVLAGTGTTVAQGTDSNGITTYTVNANTFTVRQGTTNKATIGDSTTDKVSFINGKNTVAKVADELNSNTDVTFDLADDISLNSVTTGNTTLNSSGVTVNGGANGPVKLTNTGLDNGGNKITNVAAGTVSSTSTDAVNGSQLNTTNQNVTTAQNTANTAVTNAAAAQNTANTAVTNAATAQATADKGLNFSVNGGTADNVKLGETVNFADGTNTTATYDPATNTYKYSVNDNITLTNAGSLTVGNTKIDNSGLTITGGPSVTTAGINAGNQKITNVKAGTNATDAVNFSQLNATNQNVTTAQNTANTALTNAAAAQATADKGLNFSVNGGTTDNVKLGETVNFEDGTNTTATYDPATNTYKYSVNDNIALTNAGSLTVGNTKVDDSGLTITGGPSVTTAGINAANQKITNVAAGTISSTSTDAVNGSQLNATNQNVTTAQNTANTAVTNAAAAQNTANTAVTNATAAQATADKGLNFSVNGGTADNVKLGETVNFANGTNTTATYDPATNTYKYSVNDNIALTNAGSLTVGNTKVDNSGLTITGGPSVTTAGINAGNQKITNVKAGTNATDAVNFSQLNATNQNVTTAQNTANTALTNAAAAQATADKGLNFSVNGGTTDNVKLGETVNFADGTNTTAVYDPATNTYKYSVNDNIALTNAGSLTVGNTKVDNNGLTITGGPSVTTAGINAANQKITNVAAGTNATDAVNVSQLNATNQNVTTAQNTANTALTNAAAAQATADKGLNFSVNGGTTDNVKLGETVNFADGANTTAVYDPATNTYKYNVNDNIALTNAGSLTVGNSKVDNNGLTITGGPSVTTAGINAGNQKITNVAAGTISSTSTDAVNGSQLDATNQNVTTAQNTANTAVMNAAAAQATADKGLNFSVNGGTADNVKLGETVNFADGTNTTAVYDPATNTYKYNVNDNIALTNAGSLTVGNTKVDNSGLTITGGPSVTTAGINAGNQKITNVAAGTISSTSTDAINGSQLNTTNQNVTTAQNTANTAVTNAAAAQATADKGLNFSVNGGTADNVKLGETVNFADGTNTTAVYDPATNTYKYNVNDNIALTNAGSLTVGNTKVDNSGLTITGGPSVTTAGINAGNQKITNVAAGTNATDAVNVSQLGAITTAANTKTDALGISTASNLGGGAVYNPVTGAVSSPIYTVNGSNLNNVGDAITALDKGWTLQSNGVNVGAVKAGDTVDIGTVVGESNLKVTKTGNKIQYALNRDLNIDSVTAGDSKLDTNGLNIVGGPSVTKSGINAANQKITNVAAGTISATSTDAVNGSQLNVTNQNVTTAQNTANTAVSNAAAAQATADKGLNFSVNGGTADNVKLGETVNFADGTNITAVYDPATNTYKYNVNDNIALTNVGSLTVGNTKVDNSGLTITGGPSVTTAGINAGNQKITNVTAGANATDAVNVSQLNATNQNVTTAQNTANTAMTNAAAAQATADKGLNFSVNGGTAKNVKLGETVNFADGTNTTAVYDPATNTYKYSVNDNIALTNAGSLTVGNTKVDNSGLTITGGPSVTTAGINAGNQKITNVAAGTNPTDAVNISQLGAVTTAANTKTDALGTSTASNLGGGAVYNPVTGAVSSPVYSVNGNNVNNVGDAIIALDKGWTLQSNGANAGAVKAGDTVDIGTVAGETNLKVTKTGNKIQYGLNRDLNIDSVTAGDSKLDTNGLTIAGGPSVTKSGINAANQNVTNVAAGTISSTSTDAVNGSQLNATNQNVTTAQNTANTAVTNAAAAQATADKGLNFSVNGGTAKNVKLGETVNFADGTNTTAVYDPATNTYKYSVNDNIALTNAGSLTVGNTKVDNSGLTITGGPSVTAAGIDAGNQKITNVAAGTNATDAVNVSQLGAVTTAANTKTDALGTSTASNLGGGAVYNPVTGAVSSPVYSVNGNNVNNVGDAITALDKGWTLQSNGANAGAVKAGDTVDIGTVAGETNLKVTKTGNKIQYGLNRDLNIDSVTAGDSKLDTNGLTIAGGPSVTKSGINAANQKVTNVTAGTISSTSTDAVNGSQLHTLDSRVTKNGDSTANIFGGGAKANPDGSITNPTYNVAGTSANNVGDALTALDKAVTDAGTAANAGWTVSANGDAATAKKIKPNGKVNFTGDDNLTVAQSSETDNEGNIKVALNKNLKVDSVTAGNTIIDTTGVKVGNNVQLGSTGLIIAGGPSITTSGINAGNKVITNVAAGVNTTDAVNKGQLDSAITNINNNVGALANSAVQYDKNADGTVNKDSVTFAGGANGTALKNVANGTVAAGSKDAVNGGQLWNVQQQVDKNTGDISNLKNDINNGKTGLVQQTDKDAAITVGKDTGGTQVNVAGKAGDRTVTGVKAGTVTSTSTDAVNGSQLNRTNQALVSALGGGAGYNNITESFSNPTYNVGDQSYNNVGDAIGALNQADQTLNNKIDNVNNKLEQAFYATNQRIDNLEEKMSAGIAANAALENAPFIAGKVTMAVGAAYYNQQNAVGVTLRKTADNGRWSLTTGAALGSQGSPLVRVGVSTVID